MMVSSPETRDIVIDEEAAQSRARVAICLISFLVFTGIGLHQGLGQSVTLIEGLATIIGYLVFSTAWYAMVRRHPQRWPRRRYVTLLADLGIMTFFMHLGGGKVASFYPIILWVIIGNGIRFGERYLKVGIVAGSLGFGSLLLFDEYWNTHLNVGVGLFIGIVVLPVFFLGVLRRLTQVSELKIELAQSRLADKAKDQFLATMSHEIRTPMNGVLGMAETLAATELDPQQREHLHIITRHVATGHIRPRSAEQVARALPTQSDEAHVDALAGCHRATPAQGRGGDNCGRGQRRNGAGALLEEAPARSDARLWRLLSN